MEINERPIFIVGAPRTGTTLSREILSLHSKIFLYNETHFFENIFASRSKNAALSNSIADKSVKIMIKRNEAWKNSREYCNELNYDTFINELKKETISYKNILKVFLKIQANSRGKVIWGDSTPQDILFINEILSLFPDAKIIGLVRDARDYLASNRNYYRKNAQYYLERYDPVINSILWKSYMRKLIDARKQLDDTRLHLIYYENLVNDPATEIKNLCKWLNIEFEETMLDVERSNSSYIPSKSVSKGISKQSIGRWKANLEPFEIYLVESICKNEMKELGFTPSGAKFKSDYILKLVQVILRFPVRMINRLKVKKKFSLKKIMKTIPL